MPAEVVMPPPVQLPRTSPPPAPHTAASATCSECKNGVLTLVAMNGRRQGVNVKVYRTSAEHFAVLYPQKKICRPLGVINLRHTHVYASDTPAAFHVRQQGYDTPMTITFLCDVPRERQSWVDAFSSPHCTTPLKHQSSLPIVEEDEEF